MKQFSLEIITPTGISFSTDLVEALTVPSKDGVLGILPDHVPLFAMLSEGEVKITRKNEDIFMAIGGGFIEVTKNKVKVLVTRAVDSEKINEREAIEAQKRAEDMLKQKPTGDAFLEAQTLYRRALIDLKVLRRRKYRQSGPSIPG